MSNGISGLRGGSVRIFTYSFITVWAYFYLLSAIRFQKGKNKIILLSISWALIAFQLFFCNMSRQLMLMVSLTTLLFLFHLQGISQLIIGSTACGLIAFTAIVVLNNDNLLENNSAYKIIHNTQYEAVQSSKGNIAVRLNGIKYFYPYFKKTGFLGMGMMSVTDKNSPAKWAIEHGYLFGDLAFFAILFRFGIFAVIFIIYVLWRVFKDLQLIQNTGDIEYKIIANCLIYLFISKIIFLPSSTLFFHEVSCLYYGMLFYFIYRLKSDVTNKEASENRDAVLKLTSEETLNYAK